MIELELSHRVVGSFFSVQRYLGYGFTEPVYANALAVELRCCGIALQREVPIEIVYRGVPVGAFRLDMVVEERILVEVKACSEIAPVHERQLLNYLHASRYELGLLLNFGPKATFKRFVYSNQRK